MRQQRRTRSWWEQTVEKWRRSGKSADEFATELGVKGANLRYWSSTLGRDTRAQHGTGSVQPIEVALRPVTTSRRASQVELSMRGAVIRFEEGTDVAYVAALMREIVG